MAKRKCKFCGEAVDKKAVICTSCGTNQKSGKSFKAHNVRKKKSFRKILLFLLIIATLTTCSFHIYKWHQKKSLEAAQVAAMTPKDDTVAPKLDKNSDGPKKTLNFPINITEVKDAEKYNILMSVSRGFSLKKSSSGAKIRTGRIKIRTKVISSDSSKGPFRMKIYSGQSSYGKYNLIYDRIATAKQQTIKLGPSRKERFLTLPEKYKNAPDRIKKRILEARKKAYKRMGIPERKVPPPSFCALFNYTNNKFEIGADQQNLYFRAVLCDPDGRIIKEALPKRIEIPRRTRIGSNQYDPSMKYGYDSRPPSLNGHTIYPYLNSAHRTLKFAFMEKDAFKIKSFSIDGVKYSPVFIGSTSRMGYKDRKTNIVKTYYSSSISLKYPFGGQVELKFKYRNASGKFKKATFAFYLPPPPPLIRLKASPKGDAVNISWDKIEEGIDESHFIKVPKLVLRRDNREFKRLPIYQQTSCVDKEIFRGERINYKIFFMAGIFKALLWSSEKGVQTYKLSLNQQVSPLSNRGVDIFVPSIKKEKHPVRIELLKSMICYENTGIASCELLKSLIEGINKEKDMLLYDRDSRNYIIDEKYFALSKSLKKQFQIKESDYAVQIKDYSRQDGNGLELWLFKKIIVSGGSKRTVYWRVGDIRIDADKEKMLKALTKLVAKIRETLDFYSCNDTRIKTIKPVNIICPTFRPVNQKYVIRNYEAVCESLLLTLGEKSDTVRILSKNDWEHIFNERISRFDEGHSFIESAVREILLTGRMWRKGKTKNYYIQACDAFSGEVIDCKIFSGKTRDVASELAVWVKKFRLSDDIKVDLPMSKFISKSVKYNIRNRAWRPSESLIENYGQYISKPRKRRNRIKRVQSYRETQKTTGKAVQKESFYVFVRRQWKDGFRAKAIKLLQDDWKKSKNIKTGTLLGTYYIESKRYQDAIDLFEKKWKKANTITIGSLLSSYYIHAKRYREALVVYDGMSQLDNCPKYIYDNYNSVKRKAAGEKTKRVIVKRKKRKVSKDSRRGGGTFVMDNIKVNNAMDYGATYTSYKKGKVIHTRIPRTKVSNHNGIEKDYFIDRDKIYAEWAPNQPCRTATLIFSIPKKLLSQGVNSKVVKKYGIWTKALRLAPSHTFNVEFLFRKWRWLPFKPHTKNNRFYTGSSSVAAAEDRQMHSVCKTRIIVFEAGWNSINPFNEKLNSAFSYTRLGYFFDIHNYQGSLVDSLYHRSKIRAFFELKKKPKISFPRFTFAVNSVRKAFVSRIRTGKDMIRYWALELAELDRRNNKRKLYIRGLKLYQMLALNYIVRHESNATLKRLYRTLKTTPVPTTLKDYSKSQVGSDFVVFMAYKKNKNAVKLLHLMLDSKKGYLNEKERIDYTYVLAQAGYIKLTAKMAPTYGAGVATLRWLPEKTLKKILLSNRKHSSDIFNYLIFGMRNNDIARKWFLEYNGGSLINHYFGKPQAEAYRDWKLEHFKRVKELKNKEKVIK